MATNEEDKVREQAMSDGYKAYGLGQPRACPETEDNTYYGFWHIGWDLGEFKATGKTTRRLRLTAT